MLGVKHSQQFTLEEAVKFPERSLIRVDESVRLIDDSDAEGSC